MRCHRRHRFASSIPFAFVHSDFTVAFWALGFSLSNFRDEIFLRGSGYKARAADLVFYSCFSLFCICLDLGSMQLHSGHLGFFLK